MDNENAENDQPRKSGMSLSRLQEIENSLSELEREKRDRQLIEDMKVLGREPINNYFAHTPLGIFPIESETFYQDSAQALQKVKEADPNNIQEVAASQLAIINSYYKSGLDQSKQSFRWSLIWGGIGFSFLIIAVAVLLFRQSTEVAYASGVGGFIVEAFASIYLYLYKHASDQLAAFRTSLEKTQQLLLANSMCEKLEGEIEQSTRAEIIHQMVSSATNPPIPSSQTSKGKNK